MPGEMAEWSIAAVLKTVELRGSGGSNPLSTTKKTMYETDNQQLTSFFFLSSPKNSPKNRSLKRIIQKFRWGLKKVMQK